MAITKEFGGGCLIGAPLLFKNGKKFGTLCGMDNKPFEFKPEHIQMFKSMAALIEYILELDDAYQSIFSLSAPIVPISKGVAVLPVIGKVDRGRAEIITGIALRESQRLDLDHLVIDLSGIHHIAGEDIHELLHTVKTLKLLGVNTIFTGIRPELALKTAANDYFKNITYCANLEQALTHLGFNFPK